MPVFFHVLHFFQSARVLQDKQSVWVGRRQCIVIGHVIRRSDSFARTPDGRSVAIIVVRCLPTGRCALAAFKCRIDYTRTGEFRPHTTPPPTIHASVATIRLHYARTTAIFPDTEYAVVTKYIDSGFLSSTLYWLRFLILSGKVQWFVAV